MKYIGMDAHSTTCTFEVMDRGGRVLTRACVPTREGELLRFVDGVSGRKALAFEEGMLSQWLYILLKDHVDRLVPCKWEAARGPKTDRRDAHEIADLLRVGRLTPVFHGEGELMQIRALVSAYEDIVQDLTRAKNRYKALYRQLALPTNATDFYTNDENLRQLNNPMLEIIGGRLFTQVGVLEDLKLEYRKQFEQNVIRYKEIRLLTSIPGIGPVKANQIVGIVVSPYRFRRKYNFFSYAMLTKHDQQSGGKRYGRKRVHGRSILKGVFHGAVLNCLKSNNAVRRKYDALIERGLDHRKAKGAVSKKLAATVLGVWKSGKKYDDKLAERGLQQQSRQNTS
jgi:transposase